MSFRTPFRAAALALVACTVFAAALAVAAPATTEKAAATPAKAAPAAGDPVAGKAKFKTLCITCHKVDGTGGFKSTGNPTPNWTLKSTWNATRTDAYLRDCITNGKSKSGMVAWGKTGVVKPAEIENLIAYIKTFKAAAK